MKNQYHTITQFLDRWLPSSYVQSTANKIETRIRARILVGLFLSNMLIIASSLILFILIHLLTEKNFSIAILALLAVSGVLSAEMFMFYRLGNIAASAVIFSMTFFAVTFAILIGTGGWDSPVRLLFFCSPMISFLVDGRREGFYMSALVMIVGILTLVAQKIGWQFFQVIHEQNRNIVEITIWIISLNLMVTCLAVYDAILQDFSRKIAR